MYRELGVMNIMHYRDTWISTRISVELQKHPNLPNESNKEKFKKTVAQLGQEFDNDVLPSLVGEEGMKILREQRIAVSND